MKILFINDYNYSVGGAEKFMFELKSKLEKKGHLVNVLGSSRKENTISFFSRWFSFYWYFKTLFAINSFRPDLIHVHNCARVISPSCIVTANKMKIPLVLHIHDAHWATKFSFLEILNPYNFIKNLKIKLHIRIINGCNPLKIVASKFMQNKMSFVFDKVKLVYYGIYSDYVLTNYNKQVIFSGRIIKEKGLQTIICTLNNLSEYKTNILGIGSLLPSLKKENSHVAFRGFQEPDKFYKDSSILVFPSIWEEPFGLSIVEAMSHGLCVIASDIGGIPETVKNMKTGLLFKPGDENDFREKLQYLLDNPSEIRRMGKNARKFVKKNFDWSKIIKEYEGLYKEIITLSKNNSLT